jgi:hypothetical protein
MKALALSAVIVAAVGLAPASAQTRAVVELFTSQGCSSCPPADKLASAMAADPTIVVVSMPVDYWDYLGWKDTLAQPAFTKRQKAYAAARGDRNIYTPQIVVNGLAHVVGSDRQAIGVAVRETKEAPGVLQTTVAIQRTGDGFRVSLGAGKGSGEIWVLKTDSKADVAIGRGENTGHSITYTNVVRGMVKVGDYSGSPMTIALSGAQVSDKNADGFAVFVQKVEGGKPGAILGAASYSPGS